MRVQSKRSVMGVSIVVIPLIGTLVVAQQRDSFSTGQWQVVKEPDYWLIQEPTGADVAEPQNDPQGKQKSPDEVSPPVKTEPQSPTSRDRSNYVDKSKEYNWWLVALGFGQTLTIFLQFLVGVRAANAAKESAVVAKAALRVTQRAYLSAERWELKLNEVGSVTALVGALRNTGHIPATLGAGSLNFIRSLEIPTMPDRLKLPPTRNGPFTVPAQGTLRYRFPITPEQWQEMYTPLRSREALYLYGSIAYADEFGGPHHVLFCVHCQNSIDATNIPPVDEPGYNCST